MPNANGLNPVFQGVVTSGQGVGTIAGGALVAQLGIIGIYYGSGVPTVSAPKGSLYIQSDGSTTATRMYINTNGTTGWTNFTSAT